MTGGISTWLLSEPVTYPYLLKATHPSGLKQHHDYVTPIDAAKSHHAYGQFQDQGPNSNFDTFLVVLQKCERPVELLVLQVIKLHWLELKIPFISYEYHYLCWNGKKWSVFWTFSFLILEKQLFAYCCVCKWIILTITKQVKNFTQSN